MRRSLSVDWKVAKRGSLGVIRMTQIAPTLARLLEVGLSPSRSAVGDLRGRSSPSGCATRIGAPDRVDGERAAR